MMRHGSARRLSTMLMYGGIALLCYVLLLLRRAERQHAKLQQFKSEITELRVVVDGLKRAGPRGHVLREPKKVFNRPWYRYRNVWRWERAPRGVRSQRHTLR